MPFFSAFLRWLRSAITVFFFGATFVPSFFFHCDFRAEFFLIAKISRLKSRNDEKKLGTKVAMMKKKKLGTKVAMKKENLAQKSQRRKRQWRF